MTEKENNIEKISKGVFSYLEFIKLFKKAKVDDIISKDLENKNKFSYIFRQFELECYIIDKKYLDKFRKDINFNKLINLLNPINEENKKKFKIELKKYLDKNPFVSNGEIIKLYSEINEMKELVKDFNNYSFINKELLKAMGVPESNFEGKMMKVSKNGKNTSLLSNSNNYILSIEIDKKKDKININNDDNYILNKIKNDEGYDLNLDNISYNLHIYNDDNYIYFNLIEKKEILFYSNKYDLNSIIQLLNLSPNIYNDLNKIKILFNEAYNNNKLTLNLNNNNINTTIKILYNFDEINCQIELNKENIGINEKIEFILKNLEKLNKNKSINKENVLEIENNLKHLQNSIKKLLNEIKDIKEQNEKEKNKIKIRENKKYKNLYYVEEITKKVFILLYYNEQFIQNKIKTQIKDIYNFKSYYLINNDWITEYKEFFLYDFVEKKLESEYKNKDFSYNKIKHSLNTIVKKKLGQIRLFCETILSDSIRNAKNLKYNNISHLIHIENIEEYETPDGDQNYGNKQIFNIPFKFNLINEDLYKLLIKEEFFYNLEDIVKDILSFDVLIGNNQIIIKNKPSEKNENKFKYSNEYLIYTLKNKREENNDKKNKENEENIINGYELNEKFNLKYILNYFDDNIFYNDLDKIMKGGLNNYFEYRNLDKDIKINNGILIIDEKSNYIGKFININLTKEDIENDNGIKINEQNNEDKETQAIIKIQNQIEIDYKKNKGYKEYSIDEFKQKDRKKRIENLFKDLYLNIIRNYELVDLNINEINSKEILKFENSPELIPIILMDEESSKKFQNFINYQKLNEFINSDDKTKDYLIESNHEEFNKIYNILSGSIELPNEIELIDEYKNCKKNMDINKKFQLFGKSRFNQIFKKGKNICISYFIFKGNSFIFFPKEKNILRLKYNEDIKIDNLFYLEDYIENKKDIEISYIKKIYFVGQNNLNIKIINNKIKDYYLINKKWLDFKLQEYSKITNNNETKISNKFNCKAWIPKSNNNIGINNISYPIDFYFIEKEDYSFEILELSQIFKSEPLPEYKIFFVYDYNSRGKKKNIYVGLINNLIIYFYLVKNKELEIAFVLNYYDEERILKEINDSIMINGIEFYLNMMSNSHENNNIEPKTFLYDLDLNNIGFYINLNNKEINNIKMIEYSKGNQYIPYTNFYFGVIQCLVNIKPLREIFLNKQFLIDNKLIENSPITKKLFQIFIDKWCWTNNKEVYDSLIYDINNEDSKIFNNCKLLIEFLLMHMHNEQRKENKKNYIKFDSLCYNSKDKMKEFYKNNKTFIQALFFFEIIHYYSCSKCGECKNYFISCVLELEYEKNKKDIHDLIKNLKQKNKKCEICNNKSFSSIIFFNSCPQFLIIEIKHNNKVKDKDNFKINDKIELKDYITKENHDSIKYELVSFIKNPPIEEENKEEIIYCKSPVNNEWYKYEGLRCEKKNIQDIIKNEKSIPYLLIYKNLAVDNININEYFLNN